MGKANRFLRNIMLSILLLFLAISFVLIINKGIYNKSYLFSLIIAVIVCVAIACLMQHTNLYINNWHITCIILSAICFITNLIWVMIIRIDPFSDYEVFWNAAVDISQNVQPRNPEYLAMFPHIIGYASFLSVFIKIFGQNPFIATIINVVLTTISGVFIFNICNRVFNLKTAIVAEILWAVYPSKTMLNSLVLSEPLYTCLLLLCIYLLIIFDKKKSGVCYYFAWGVIIGLVLFTINIIRPISIIIIIAIIIWLFALGGVKSYTFSDVFFSIIFVVAATTVFFITNKLWNAYLESLLSIQPSSIPIYNIYVGFNSDTQGQWCAQDMDLLFNYMNEYGMSPREAQNSLIPHLMERLSSTNYIELFKSKLFSFLCNDDIGGYTYRYTKSELFVSICIIICNIAYYTIMIFTSVGIIKIYSRKSIGTVMCLIPLYVLGLTIVHMIIEVCCRYHYSMIPMMIMIASYGITEVNGFNFVKNKRKPCISA